MNAQRVSTRDLLPPLLFLGIVIGIYGVQVVLAGLLPTLERPGPVAVGMTLDMVVAVPVVFYFLVVRRRGWPAVTVVPVVILGLVAASRILPEGYRQPVGIAEALVVPLEIGLVAWIVWRAPRALRGARRAENTDPLEQFRCAGREVLRNDRVASIFASEIGVFYYAFFAWRARPDVRAGSTPVTQHRRSGHLGIVVAVVMLVLVEGLAVHFLVALWSDGVAWCLTVLSGYTVLWLIADYRATLLRPISVGEDSLRLRAGLRWSLDVPREWVAAVRHEKPDLPDEPLNLTFLGTPTRWVQFRRPVVARGPYGLRREVTAVAIQPDEPDELERAVSTPGQNASSSSL